MRFTVLHFERALRYAFNVVSLMREWYKFRYLNEVFCCEITTISCADDRGPLAL
jgi:hypothetical protein